MSSIVWARTKLEGPRPWVFLAGPTTRDPDNLPSWRPDAAEIFDRWWFEGTIIIPEDGPNRPPFDEWLHSEKQVYWEWDAIEQADCVMFWVPRLPEGEGLMGLTTNTEFGYLVTSGKVALGYPDGAFRVNYLSMLGARHGVQTWDTLEDTISEAIRISKARAKAKPHVEW